MIKKRVPNIYEVKCERFLHLVWKELRLDFKNMIKWLFFYKTDSQGDKILHICEVVFMWIIFTKVFFGV